MIIGAGSLVSPATSGKAATCISAAPAKAVRPLKPEEYEGLKYSANNYVMENNYLSQGNR